MIVAPFAAIVRHEVLAHLRGKLCETPDLCYA